MGHLANQRDLNADIAHEIQVHVLNDARNDCAAAVETCELRLLNILNVHVNAHVNILNVHSQRRPSYQYGFPRRRPSGRGSSACFSSVVKNGWMAAKAAARSDMHYHIESNLPTRLSGRHATSRTVDALFHHRLYVMLRSLLSARLQSDTLTFGMPPPGEDEKCILPAASKECSKGLL